MIIETRTVEQLANDPNNARKHDDKNINAIKGSLAKFGQQKPIVIDKNNVVIAGNGTLEAARQLGWTDISVVVTDLDSYEKTAYSLADNRSGEMSDWDKEILGQQLISLEDMDFDLESIGFDADYGDPDFDFKDPGDKDDETKPDEIKLTVFFESMGDQREVFDELKNRGYKVK